MGTGFRGTFVISWSQTEVDGLEAAPVQSLTVGAAWAWRGDAVRVDGPQDVLRLDGADGYEAMRRKAARMVHRLVGAALARGPNTGTAQGSTHWTVRGTGRDEFRPHPNSAHLNPPHPNPMTDSSFVVTDGAKSYTITVIEVGNGAQPLLMFIDDIPPRKADLWIVHHTLNMSDADGMAPGSGGVICFTPGTLIDTPEGAKPIEQLREGDRVQTRDNGAQDILWIGSRRMTGARLFAMPRLRPVRIALGALGVDRPDLELLVSPEHRMLIKGDVARDLFNTDEVLVAAKDLINGTTITVDLKVRQVTYIHLLLPRHEILRANGVDTESFHPANAALSTLDDSDRARLLSGFPALEFDAHTYGSYARRNLSASEAAILHHAA